MNIEHRLVDIEIKLTAQEDMVQSLSDQLYQQQKQMDELRALCAALVKRLQETAADGGDAGSYAHEKPPHY